MYAKPIYVVDGARTPFLKAKNRPGVFSAGDLATRRAEFADELHALVRRVRTTQTWAAQRFLEVMRGH